VSILSRFPPNPDQRQPEISTIDDLSLSRGHKFMSNLIHKYASNMKNKGYTAYRIYLFAHLTVFMVLFIWCSLIVNVDMKAQTELIIKRFEGRNAVNTGRLATAQQFSGIELFKSSLSYLRRLR